MYMYASANGTLGGGGQCLPGGAGHPAAHEPRDAAGGAGGPGQRLAGGGPGSPEDAEEGDRHGEGGEKWGVGF